MTERTIQAVLMDWAMNIKQHQFVVPNVTGFFGWEADLISITRGRMVHEYEIKLSAADYRRDALKGKHRQMLDGKVLRAPSYFWYVTHGFDIEPPEHAGWIAVERLDGEWRVEVKRDAPRLRQNVMRVTDQMLIDLGHLLSWRLVNHYNRHYSDIHQTRRAREEAVTVRALRRELARTQESLDRSYERQAALEAALASSQLPGNE
jgi:hypothetical protein